MRPFCLSQIAFIVALCSALPASAASLAEQFQVAREQGVATTVLNIDNDSLLFNREDGFYTSGLRLEQQYALSQNGGQVIYAWRFGQQLFTSSDIKLPAAQVAPSDHPYAGWLYAGAYRETLRADGSHESFAVDLGCLGPCAGGYWTQTNLHRLLRQPLPQGWSSQVKNEVGLVLTADVAPVRWRFDPWLDLTPNFHGRFGNIHTDAGAGLTLRFGQMDRPASASRWYGFSRIDGELVAYNAMLQGGYFSSGNPHTVQPKRVVGEAELGAAWRSGALGLSASVVRRGNEIRALENSRGGQSFVRLLFSYTP